MTTGEIFGPFKLIRPIGHGGMGSVHLAEDASGRLMALKLVPEHLSKNEMFRKRFQRECTIIHRLSHPGIPRFYEQGEHEGRLFLTMEYVEGWSLEWLMQNQPGQISFDWTRSILLAAARILAHAHAEGVIHRDIAPKNILLTAEGDVKLIDFGISKVADEVTLTMTGQHFGTPAYMAPEQFGQAANDAASDLWSVGVVGFRMLTGRMPFTAENDMAMIQQIVNPQLSATAVLDANPGVSPDLAMVVDRLLQKERAHRYADAGALAAALENSHEPPAEVFDPAKPYRLGDLVYLPHAKRWAAVEEEGRLGKRSYVSVAHQGGQTSRRVCDLKSAGAAQAPVAGGGTCPECGASAVQDAGRETPGAVCASCGLIPEESWGMCRPTISKAILERRNARNHQLKKIGAGSAAVFTLGVAGFYAWLKLTSPAPQVESIESKTTSAKKKPPTAYGKVEGLILDVNTASFADLVKIKGLGDRRAMIFLAYRHNRGPFKNMGELRHALWLTIQGFGGESIIPYMKVDTVRSAPAGSAPPADPEFSKRYRRIDLNSAGKEDLTDIPFFSDESADYLVRYRKTAGNLRGFSDVITFFDSLGSNVTTAATREFAALDFVSLGDDALDRIYKEQVNEYYAKSIPSQPVQDRVDLNHASLLELSYALLNKWSVAAIMMHRHRRGAFRSVDEYFENIQSRLAKDVGADAEKLMRAVLYVTPGKTDATVDPLFVRDWGSPVDINTAPQEKILQLPFLTKGEYREILQERAKRRFSSVDELRTLMPGTESAQRRFEFLKDFVTVK